MYAFDAFYGATVQSLQQCEGKCSDRSECIAFVHQPDNGGYCGLYNGGPATGGDGTGGLTCYLKEGGKWTIFSCRFVCKPAYKLLLFDGTTGISY